ncbi:RHS repeat-associated core domain-containing protein [Stenotrophomonas tuberculopleuritidis]|uniref:RHS repeat-associated core domain-containing protein n=1 Tax=Stenotrophomonas tuberculopleuritidis TaxID=3055079 RepID=UPI0026E57B65|nr:RHS repeat-associated core domain-containing protein [Stenotrophomonas sp. 704A1]
MNGISSLLIRAVLAVVLLAACVAPAAGQEVVEYIHTDALGSPVAITDAGGNVIERTVYEPYGAVVSRALKDGPGYTGHVTDSGTGLSYMEQRYYDSELGVFLSVDPIAAYSHHGGQNRYWYANQSPYKFTDPDGRSAALAFEFIVPVVVLATGYYVLTTPQQRADMGRRLEAGIRGVVKQSQANSGASPDKAIVDDLTRGKGPAPGEAGKKGELGGDPDGGDADWNGMKDAPGVTGDDRNLKLPGGGSANRHDSTRPYPDGLVPKGTDTIRVYVTGSKIPITVRYPKKP